MRATGSLCAIIATAAMGSVAGACGTSKELVFHGHRHVDYRTGDYDVDDLRHPRPDGDDHAIRDYAHSATTSEISAITALVKHYYDAAHAGDGISACLLLDSRFRSGKGLIDAVPAAYRPAPGSSVFKDKSCPWIAGVLFKIGRGLLDKEITGLHVTAVRVGATRGKVVLGFESSPERWLPIRRDTQGWRIGALLDSEMP